MATNTRLVADVGGTNTRLALFDPSMATLRRLATYSNRDHASLEEIVSSWLRDLDEPAPLDCCIAVAAPLSGDQVTMININWSFSCRELASRFGFSRFLRLNDFQANAFSLPHLGLGDTELLHAGQARAGAKLATMGPGTGLGGATLDWVNGVAVARDSEPGHCGLSPATDLELELFRLLVSRHGEVHAEFLVSGIGLQRIYLTLAEIRGKSAQPLSPAEISRHALDGSDGCCERALKTFCALLGSACGDFVLANGAYGGMYVAGGIVPRMIPFLKASSFRQRFCDKGAMAHLLDKVPLHVITAGQPGLIGAAHAPLGAPPG